MILSFSLTNFKAINIYKKGNKSIKNLSLRLIDLVYKNENNYISSRVNEILKFNEQSVDFISLEEREFPGNSENVSSGYYHTMFKRYVFAGKWFCEGKTVLDSCSGLGWGTYILSKYAFKISAFDISDESINFSKRNWKTSNVNWLTGDALNLTNYEDNFFDVAVAMETIEHFSKENGEKYILNLKKKLKNGGVLIGSSAFPFFKKKADLLCASNPYHLHVYTYIEFSNFLKAHFCEVKLIGNWMFVARK